MENFPPNSRKVREGTPPPKRVQQVTSASAVRKRPSLGKQFSATFMQGSANTAFQYMTGNVLIPAVRDMLVEAGRAGIENLFYGSGNHGRRPSSPSPYGRVSYHQPVQRQPPAVQQVLPRTSRARHAFGDIIIATRPEAEEVLDRMFDLLSQYESVTVADLYELTGIRSAHTDHKWGWVELTGADVGRTRDGRYILDLPDPEPLNN